MRRFRLGIIVSAVVLSVIWFVVSTWYRFSGGVGVGWAVAVALLAVGYIPVAILGFRTRSRLLRAAAVPAAISIGLLSFGLVSAATCWIVEAACRIAGLPVSPHSIGFGVYGLALLVAVFGLVNAATIRVTRYSVALRGLPDAWEGRTGVLVSDVHLGNIHGSGFARRVVMHIRALRPDAVFVAGDMFDGAKVDLQECAAPWGRINAPLGTYFVTGNHDEFSDASQIASALRGVGIRVLDDEKVTVEGLQIIGVHDGTARDARKFGEILERARVDRDRASILLNHQPAHLDAAERAGISLQLSGHTHGGQFWPWTHLVSRIFGPFAYGLNRRAATQVITSSGVGTWGPPMRVATRSEIVLIQFASA